MHYFALGQFTCETDGNVPNSVPDDASAYQAAARCYTVRVYFHIVRQSDGSGGQPTSVISTIMNNFNSVYSNYGINFDNVGNDQINNSNYLVSFDLNKFNSLINTNKVSNAINIYLLDDNTFNGGRANGIPGNALVVGGVYTVPGGGVQPLIPSLVVPHEMGHCLGLYHTFETFIGSERADESNCTTAGDLVCDTPADRPGFNFTENSSCNFTASLNDQVGQPLHPDPRNVMTYVRPSCMNSITNGQAERIRRTLGTSSVLASVISSGPNVTITDVNATGEGQNYFLTAVATNMPGATAYKWYIDGILAETTADYSWDWNGRGSCGSFHEVKVEVVHPCSTTSVLIATYGFTVQCNSYISVYPNPASSSMTADFGSTTTNRTSINNNESADFSSTQNRENLPDRLEFFSESSKALTLSINVKEEFDKKSFKNDKQLEIDLRSLPRGVYYLRVVDEKQKDKVVQIVRILLN